MIMLAKKPNTAEPAADATANTANITPLVEKFFGTESPLRNAEKHGYPKYEERPQQREMALNIATALEKGENLCIEAPTGIGKSYAYLVPAALFAKKHSLPVIVSTETINLQEQLVHKDIPVLDKMIEGGFKAALAKGRSHYVCLRRMHFAQEKAKEELFDDNVAGGIRDVARWISGGGEGDRSQMGFQTDPYSWSMVCCETGNCMGPKCQHYRDCFYWRARRTWDEADIVVTNHALLFTSIKVAGSSEYSLLPESCAIVFDEAHTIENEASSHCGLRLNKLGFESFLRKLFDPDKSRGIFFKGGTAGIEIRAAVSNILELSSLYFNSIDNIIHDRKDGTTRFRNPGFVQDLLSEELSSLSKLIQKACELESDENASTELKSYIMKTDAFANEFHNFTCMTLENHVYWAERGERGKTELFAAPLDIREILGENLFNGQRPVVLTSATLSVKKSLQYFCGRIGFAAGESVMLDTVFDYASQMKIYIPKDIAPPEHQNYLDELCDGIRRYVSRTHGKAFVLFTNFEHLRACAEKLRDFFKEKGITLLVHGDGLDRTRMLDKFRKDVDSVIFGAASFWSGVDVPGESLSNVIITKLPFLVPSHPLVEARSETIEKEGGSSFTDYQLPEAILRFRQGIGRLIRTKTDRGIVAILDSRITKKSYGKAFLSSIPECEVIKEE